MDRLDQLLDMLEDAYFETNGQGKITFYSHGFARLLKKQHQNLLGQSLSNIFDLNITPSMGHIFHQLKSNSQQTIKTKMNAFTSLGGKLPVQVMIQRLFYSSTQEYRYSFLVKESFIPEEKFALTRYDNQGVKDIFDSVSVFLYTHDLKGRFREINQALIKKIGRKGKKAWELNVSDILPLRFLNRFDHYIKQLISKGQVEGNLYFLTNTGEERLVEFKNVLIKDQSGRPLGAHGAAKDITKRQKTEIALRRSQANLVRSQKMARLGSWELKLPSGKMSCSKEMLNILAIPASHAPMNIAEYLTFVHPSDRKEVQKNLDLVLSRKVAYENEHRIILPNGKERILNSVIEAVIGPNGKPNILAGTLQDITQKRNSEARIRLLAKAFENALEGMIITDHKGYIQMVNPGFTSITGYNTEYVKGKHVNLLSKDSNTQSRLKEIWQGLKNNGAWQGQTINRRKNGESYPQWLSIKAIFGDDNKICHYVASLRDLTALKKGEEKIIHQAHHDALTQLPNRTLFNQRLKQAIRKAKEQNGKLAVLFLDLDNFKNINDSLGHTVGDKLLQRVAIRLKNLVRSQDTFARLGGDEFIMILPDTNEKSQAVQIAQRVLEACGKPFFISGKELFVTASIGLTLFPDDGSDIDTLVSNADMAMYQAKGRGKNTLRLFTPSMNRQITKRMALEKNLRTALKNHEFEIHFQPKVNLKTGHMAGAEALVRWRRKGEGLVGPHEFICLAEETGLIIPLGEWVLEQSCRYAKNWLDNGHESMPISVNLSPKQFMQKDLAQRVKNILDSTGLPPKALELELTENMVMQNVDLAIDTMERLNRMGVQLSLDDFGKGYSSLYYLKRFPMNELKIDRSFVEDIQKNADDASIVNTIISMGRSLKLRVVAEGVETKEQLYFLRENQCDLMQGFLFQKPVPEKSLRCLLKEGRKLDFA